MSEAIAFDTHRFVKRLTDCGFTERQAETLAEEHVALLGANLATKADIAKVKADIAKVETDIAKVETDIAKVQTDIAKVEADIAKVQADIAKVQADIAKVEADIAKVQADITKVQADIAKVEVKLEVKLEAVKADLLKWMFGAMIAQGGLIVALVKLL